MATAAAVKKLTKAADVDLSGLSSTELQALAQTASNLRYQRQEEEAAQKHVELLGGDLVTTFKKKIKDLAKEYKDLPRKMSVTLQVPIKFEMSIEDQWENLEDLVRNMSSYSYEFSVEELLTDYQFSGKLVTKDSNLDKVQKPYFENAISDMTSDACEESLNLFKERKQLRDFAKKLDAALTPVREACRSKGINLSFNTILGTEKE